jgi:hypothetical protein
MTLATTNGRMAVMEWEGMESGFMLSATDPFSQGDKQQLIWGIPEVLWGDPVDPGPAPDPNPQSPSSQGGGAVWPGPESYKKKRKKQSILDDDEDLMRIIAMALPELIQRYRKR